MSAMVMTADFALVAAPMGVTISPISASLVSTTPAKGARIRVYSSAIFAPSSAARLAFTVASDASTAAFAFS